MPRSTGAISPASPAAGSASSSRACRRAACSCSTTSTTRAPGATSARRSQRRLEEIPAGITVVAISRGDPPPSSRASSRAATIGRLGAEALRFTREEAGALLGAAGAADERVIDRVWERVDGWAAGLVLLHEHAAAGGQRDDAGAPGPPHAVFDYFAGEILASLAPDLRRAAMVSALLPQMSVPVVVELTGHPQIGRLLDAGYRRRLFVTRTDAAEPVYRYHALFREFLLGRLRAEVPSDELASWRRRAAALLEAAGAAESAFDLYRDAGDWPNAVRMTLADAPAMIARGQVRPLAERIAALPDAERSRDPWLALYEGRARVNIDDPLAALASFERAHQGFVARGDTAGQIQAAEAAIGSRYLAWEDWRPIHRWVDILQQLLAGRPRSPRPTARRARCPRSRSGSRTAGRDTRCSPTASDGWKGSSTRSRTGPRA